MNQEHACFYRRRPVRQCVEPSKLDRRTEIAFDAMNP